MEIVEQKVFEQVLDRKCGSCTACCTYLGIDELKKHTGEKCKHLRGPAHIHKRCSIYARRPTACSTYQCIWRAGWGLEEWQPNKTGILISVYPEDDNPDLLSITMSVFDETKAKPYLGDISSQLLLLPNLTALRVINFKSRKVLYYKNGNVYIGRLLPTDGYEELMFETDDVPIGKYHVKGN